MPKVHEPWSIREYAYVVCKHAIEKATSGKVQIKQWEWPICFPKRIYDTVKKYSSQLNGDCKINKEFVEPRVEARKYIEANGGMHAVLQAAEAYGMRPCPGSSASTTSPPLPTPSPASALPTMATQATSMPAQAVATATSPAIPLPQQQNVTDGRSTSHVDATLPRQIPLRPVSMNTLRLLADEADRKTERLAVRLMRDGRKLFDDLEC